MITKKPDNENPILIGIENVEGYLCSTARELYDITPPPEIIEDFLPQGGIMGITSFPGVGKSWLTFEVIRSVSLGKPFLNKFSTQQGSCLFVGSDSSIFDYARQWSRIARTDEQSLLLRTADPDEDPEENRREEQALKEEHGPDWPLGPFHSVRFLLQSPFMFDSPDEIRRLISTARHFEWGPFERHYDELEEFEGEWRRSGFNIIVFDTLSRLTRADQNNNSEMEEVFRNIRSISELTGAAIIVLHHNSKRTEYNDGADWRGAMSQIGALDSWVQLSAARKDKYRISAEFKKFRGITPENFVYKMEVTDPDKASLEIATPVADASTTGAVLCDAVEEHLLKHAGVRLTVQQIALALMSQYSDLYGGNVKKFQNSIRGRLEDVLLAPRPGHPQVHKQGGGQRAVPAYYWIEKVPDAQETQEVQAKPEVPASPERGHSAKPSKKKASPKRWAKKGKKR